MNKRTSPIGICSLCGSLYVIILHVPGIVKLLELYVIALVCNFVLWKPDKPNIHVGQCISSVDVGIQVYTN